MKTVKLNPSLFDKLSSDLDISGLRADRSDQVERELDRISFRFHNIPQQLERFGEQALKMTLRRDTAWLLNTTNFESAQSLDNHPEVRTSVLNYGVADLTGKARSQDAIEDRAARIREALLTFEPRFNSKSVRVKVSPATERENAITFVITGDITSALADLPVRLLADIEADTGATTVRE